jgi:hypothetical protein
MENTIKSSNSNLDYLLEELKDIKRSPWGLYIMLDKSDIVETFNNKGFEYTKELLNRTSINAYHRDEAVNGCI